jgi:hypothetical protein
MWLKIQEKPVAHAVADEIFVAQRNAYATFLNPNWGAHAGFGRHENAPTGQFSGRGARNSART